MANTAQVKFLAVFPTVSEQCGVVRRHGEKQRGAVALDVRVDAGGSRASRRENGCGATGEREVAGIAQAIGEE